MSTAEQVSDEESTDLGDQLFQVRNHTLDDDRVRGEITGVDDQDETIVVNYTVLTTEQETSTEFPKPATWTTSNPFVRLVEFCGYNSASAMQLEDEIVPLRHEDDDEWSADSWEIDIDRMPGEQFLDRSDYYNGAFAGAIGALLVAAAVAAPGVIGFSHPSVPMIGLRAILGVIAAWGAIKFVHVPPQDDRRTLSYDEIEVGFDD